LRVFLQRPAHSGFSLIELLLVVVIIGILAAVALPSYRSNVLAAGRAEGKSLLLQVASQQQQFFSVNNSYSINAGPLSTPPVEVLISSGKLYQVSVSSCPEGEITYCFLATATPLGRQNEDACRNMSLTHTGLKGASGANAEDCWR
jgi:type IV pilus assembly protein PilE